MKINFVEGGFAELNDKKKLMDLRDLNTVFDVSFWEKLGIPVDDVEFNNEEYQENKGIEITLYNPLDYEFWHFLFIKEKNSEHYSFSLAFPHYEGKTEYFFDDRTLNYLQIMKSILELNEIHDPLTSETSLEVEADHIPI